MDTQSFDIRLHEVDNAYRRFDTKVQLLKYKVLLAVARHAWQGDLLESVIDIPTEIIPGKTPSMRCCVYKERAILGERVKLAMGGPKDDEHIIHVIDIACDDCPAGGYEVSDSCRGCLAHRCENVCPRGAISYDSQQKAHIDKSKCINCGRCAQVCPYSAITNRKRPCEVACKVGAIGMAEDRSASIDYEKCISCGACVYQCPWGALTDKSYILDAIRILKQGQEQHFPVYAVVAPSIASQFSYAKLGQVITGLGELGFTQVFEAASGADMVAQAESRELAEKGFLTSSCCPAFVDYIRKAFPDLADKISHTLSPMATICKYIKEHMPGAKTIFVGPCTAKKAEMNLEPVRPWVDCVITFEELQALFDSKFINLNQLEETSLDSASYFGRIFARCGGLSDAVAEALKEQGITDFVLKGVRCDGIEDCRKALLLVSKGKLDANFIEGMACLGGCVGGAGCLTHGERNKLEVNKYGALAGGKTIGDAVKSLGL